MCSHDLAIATDLLTMGQQSLHLAVSADIFATAERINERGEHGPGCSDEEHTHPGGHALAEPGATWFRTSVSSALPR